MTNIGWVFSYLEGAKMPLSQVTAYTPFSTNNVPVQLETVQGLPTQDQLRGFAAQYTDWDAYVCGPTPFMAAAVAALKELEFPRERRHQEKFVSLGGNPPIKTNAGYQRHRVFLKEGAPLGSIYLWLFMVIGIIVDSMLTGFRLRRMLAERFPNENRKGAVAYALLRTLQFRRFRLPAPQVRRGERP